MTTTNPHLNLRRRRAPWAPVAVLTLVCWLLLVPSSTASGSAARSTPGTTTGSYGWPVKPFHAQHPVRGFFGDPRISPASTGIGRAFHFGVDVSCPDGTPVYATLSGRVVFESSRPETVTIVAASGDPKFAYWHITPSVRNGETAVAYRTVLGHVARGWEHVHFAEFRGGAPVNPLRPGALAPFADTTLPHVSNVRIERDGRSLARASGTFDLVAEAYDTTPIPVAAPWNDRPVTPAVVRWRVVGSRTWRTAVDVRWTIPSDNSYASFFAIGTRQNTKSGGHGRYRFFLAHDLDAAALAHGTLAIDVRAIDTRGNSTTRRFTLPGAGRPRSLLTSARPS